MSAYAATMPVMSVTVCYCGSRSKTNKFNLLAANLLSLRLAHTSLDDLLWAISTTVVWCVCFLICDEPVVNTRSLAAARVVDPNLFIASTTLQDLRREVVKATLAATII